jgi:enterochelin esterase-like enzyme
MFDMSTLFSNISSRGEMVARLRAWLAGTEAFDPGAFWRDVASIGAPLITREAGDQREVTFLWRSAADLQTVYLRLNRITDKEHVAAGMMARHPGSDIWTVTLRLPASYRGSYTFTEIPVGTPKDVVALLGGRRPPFPSLSDPFSQTPKICVRGTEQETVLALDHAPRQDEWTGVVGEHSGTLTVTHQYLAGRKRQVRLYVPDVSLALPLGLLVLPDAEIWFDHLGVAGAVDRAIGGERIAPFAILGIDNLDESDRAAILGGRVGIVREIGEGLVPWVYDSYADRTWAGRDRTVFSGQSLGGVTALMAAIEMPEVFGVVLSHSPSMWWTPDGKRLPFMFTEDNDSWVTERVMSASLKDVRLRLTVGSLEGVMVPHVRRLHERLVATGAESELVIYTGGHDFAWWRGALIDGLASL